MVKNYSGPLRIIQNLLYLKIKLNLGRRHQLAASLSDIWSTTPSSDTNNSRIHCPFLTIGSS